MFLMCSRVPLDDIPAFPIMFIVSYGYVENMIIVMSSNDCIAFRNLMKVSEIFEVLKVQVSS